MIVGIMTFIGSCKKSEDKTTATSSTGCQAVSACSSTASGTITGLDNASLSGTLNLTTKWTNSLGGVDNSTGCTTNSTLLSSYGSNLPSGTAAFTLQRVITSSSSFAQVTKSYSDTACSSELASLVIGFSDVSLSDNVTGLTASTSNDLGTNATKASFKESCLKGKGTTDAGTTWLTSYTTGSSITWTTGEEQICSSSQAVKYALWHVDNSSKIQNSSGGYDNYTKNVWDEMSSSSSYPTDWNADGSGFSSYFEL